MRGRDRRARWALQWTFANGQRVATAWQVGAWGQTGSAVTVTDAGWNAVLTASQPREFGFIAGWAAMNAVPTDFRLNGRPCTAG